jgi:hypothetical protein
MDKRYQIFISSTYADLKEERRAVIQTIIELDCIPAGMELFPAADEEQLAFIKRVIDDCDYYLLIIGGRYGSVDESGISYTEQEYDYAVSRGLKVIALLHENPDEIPLGKSEKEPVLRERLQGFRDKVSTGRLVKFWGTVGELPGLVSLSLSKTIRMSPAVGWVRADRVANEEILGEINNLRKNNEWLKAELAKCQATPALEGLAGLDEEVAVKGTYHDNYYRARREWQSKVTWRKAFAHISPYLVAFPSADGVKETLARALFGDSPKKGEGGSPILDDQNFQTIGVQLVALGFVKIEYIPTTTGTMGLFWSLTDPGRSLMMELRTVRTKVPVDDLNKGADKP